MNALLRLAGAIAVVLALLPWSGPTLAAGVPLSGEYAPGELLVKFKPGARAAQKPLLSGIRMRANVRSFQRLGIEHWELPEGADIQATMDELRASPEVEFVEPNYRRHLRNIRALECHGQWALDDMNVPTGVVIDPSVTVAVIDTGVELTSPHPELAGTLIKLDADPRDPGQPPPPQEPMKWGDSWWHGTAVAAAIAGNGVGGVAGVAQGVKILPLRTSFYVSSLVGLYDVLIALNDNDDPDDDVYILNASWGGPQFSIAESAGIAGLRDAGILVVAAAGNYDTDNDLIADYPSSLPLPNVLSVGASGETGELTAWSHFGAASVDVAAPGEWIKVAVPTGSDDDGYGCASGTSFSAPHVSGIAARIASKLKQEGWHGDRKAFVRELKARIVAGVAHVEENQGLVASGGRVDAQSALSVEPRPLFVYAGHSVVDLQANGNGVLEPGELAQLKVSLENLWETAGTVSVRLTSPDTDLHVHEAQATFDDAGVNPQSVSFPVQLSSDVVGHRRIPLTLEIDAGGELVKRYFHLEIGTLQEGVPAAAAIQEHDQDDMQVWTFHLSEKAARLEFTLKGKQGDLDLYATSKGALEFDRCTTARSKDMKVSARAGSQESIVIEGASAGTYRIAVVNWYDCGGKDAPPENVGYTLVANVLKNGGGGGGGEGAWLAVFAAATFLVRRMRTLGSVFVLMPLLLAGCPSAAELPARTSGTQTPLELLVTVDERANRAEVQQHLERAGADVLHAYEHIRVFHIRAPAGLDLRAAQERFGAIPGVIAVEPEHRRRLY